jgi:hypothetical protein
MGLQSFSPRRRTVLSGFVSITGDSTGSLRDGFCPHLDAYDPCASIVTLNRKSIQQRPQPHFTFFTTIPSGKWLENILMFSLEFTLKYVVKNNISFSLYFPVKNSH